MAEKKTTDATTPTIPEVTKVAMEFNKQFYELGLTLIEDYRIGRCRDCQKTLEAIIEIAKIQTDMVKTVRG